MANTKLPTLLPMSEYKKAAGDRGQTLKQLYLGDPEGLAERLGVSLPKKPLQVKLELGIYDPEVDGPITPGLRDLVIDVCLGDIEDAAAVGPRGGGKSKGVSFIEFYKVFLEEFDALNLGGSELQADQVYQYLLEYIESDQFWATLLKNDPQISKTTLEEGNWIRVLAASQKSVRSPHAGGKRGRNKKRGGILVLDEEAEASPEIVNAALPTVNTALPSVTIRCSTFHNAEGSFADLIDNHIEMGYKLYSWDIIDIAERCDCVGKCQNPEPCFREDHVEKYADPDTGVELERVVHKAYCGGRAMYASGWIPMKEIIKEWRRMKRNHSTWEVEAMGSRPKSSGFVLKDRVAYARNKTADSASSLYVPGYPVTVCVDWGATAAGVTAWQEQRGRNLLLEADLLEETSDTQLLGKVVEYSMKYRESFYEIAADIGGGGQFFNPKLRDEYGLPVRDVNFQEEKETAVAAWNILNEAGKCLYPEEFEDFDRQVKRWKRRNGRIVKGEDHLCDSAVCYFSKFVDEMGIRAIGVAAQTFRAEAHSPGRSDTQNNGTLTSKIDRSIMVPLVRTLGSKNRR